MSSCVLQYIDVPGASIYLVLTRSLLNLSIFDFQVVVRHHGRPIKLDLDCSETLRCPLLYFPRPSDASMHPVANHRALHRTEDSGSPEGESEGGKAQMADDDIVTVETSKGDGKGEQQGETDDSLDNGGHGQGSTARIMADTSRRSKSVDTNSDTVSDQNDALPHPDRIDHGPKEGGSSGQHHLTQEQHQHDQQYRHQDTYQSCGDLVPARLVAVLVDGSGKGWMAARRLWSVVEVGFNALAEVGLAMSDVDLEQEVG